MTDFVNVAGLYERQTPAGRTIWFGQWGQTRLYLFPCDANNGPVYWLAIRAEDYHESKHGPRLVEPQR